MKYLTEFDLYIDMFGAKMFFFLLKVDVRKKLRGDGQGGIANNNNNNHFIV